MALCAIMEEKFLTIDGNKIRFLESGHSKDTLLLIHGIGASAERWLNVLPYFEKHYRVIVPDLIGFGYSDKPLVDYTPSFFVDFLKKFIQRSGVDLPILIGSSLGGQITAEFASLYSDKIKQLVLVSPAGVMKQSTPALDAYIMAALYPNLESAKNAFRMMEASGKEIDSSIINGFIERMQMPNAKMAFMSTLLGLKNADSIVPRLHNIKVPTLLIWGEKDPVIPTEYSKEFLSTILNCKFYEMKGCGHTPYVQEPEEFFNAVTTFLENRMT